MAREGVVVAGGGVLSQRVHPQRAPAALVTRPWACARTVRRASGKASVR